MADPQPPAKPTSTTRPVSIWRQRATWPRALVVVLVMVLLAEGSMRALEDHLPRNFAGDQIEVELKYDQLRALAAADDEQPVDILFLGNSTMDAALNPAVFAEASQKYDKPYNAALLGQPLPSVRRWAEQFVMPRVSPNVVVLGVTPLDLPDTDLFGVTKTAVEAAFDNTFDRLDPTPLQNLDRRVSSASALVRQRSAFRSPIELWRAVQDKISGEEKQFSGAGPTTLETGETVLRTREVWEQRLLQPRGGNANYWGATYDGVVFAQMSDAEKKVFSNAVVDVSQIRNVVDVIRDAGVDRVILVITPHNLDGLERTGGSLDGFRRSTQSIIEFGRGEDIPVVDFTRADWPLADYFDLAHLSKAGSTRFSTELATVIDSL